ncbi:prepilin-type N-terminal cleavage/methylation domain-containing protein [Candidatus Saccharibacteria bacterium]|nr:prepilin-type N-terminal cleavage/methylation domain-containing protein [Candidatus Saccharibacteria bacterium]
MNFTQPRVGFTIVELLIVIVVIGVLAGVSTVAFNGVTDRANMTRVIAQTRNVYAAVKLYHATNGTWPLAGWVCVGNIDDFPAQDDFPLGACAIRTYNGGATWEVWYAANNTLMNDLGPYLGPSYKPLLPVLTPSAALENNRWYYKWRGVVYDNYNMAGRNATVFYGVRGSTCPLPLAAAFYYSWTGGRECGYDISGPQN